MSYYTNQYQQLREHRNVNKPAPTTDVFPKDIRSTTPQSFISVPDHRASSTPQYHIFRDVSDNIPLTDYHYPFPEDLVSETSYNPRNQEFVAGKQRRNREQDGLKRRFRWPGWVSRWWIEVSAFLLMLVAVASTVVTLYLHQGKPLPQWPLKISINTLIAVYAVVFKGGMLLITAEGLSELKWSWYHSKPRRLIDIARLDAASRGPWGSLMLLGTMRLKFLMASLGAFITLVGLGVDPFAQLVIQFHDCTISSTNSTASIPRRNAYGYMGGHIGAGIGWLDTNMMASVVAGTFNPSVVDTQCPSGNCDFPPYYSIGCCATCTDVTKNLTQICQTVPVGTSNLTQRICDIRLISQSGYNNVSLTNASLTRDIFSMSWQTSYGANLVKAQSPFFDNFQYTPQWNDSGLGAATCVLKPCVKQYSAQIRTGRFNETSVANIDLSHFGSETYLESGPTVFPYYTTVHVPCLNDQERKSLIAAGYKLNSGTEWLPFNGTNYMVRNQSTGQFQGYPNGNLTINDTCIFRYLYNAWLSLDIWMAPFLSGSVNVTEYQEWSEPSGPGQIQALYSFGRPLTFSRVEQYFTGIADSITTAIRQYNSTDLFGNPASYQADVVGTVLEDETCVYVTWQWIVLPATLIVLTGVFLVGSIVTCPAPYTNRLWKSSILASMFHPLVVKDDIVALTQSDRADDLVEMEKVAKKMTVQLHDDGEGGIRFRNAISSQVSLVSSQVGGVR